ADSLQAISQRTESMGVVWRRFELLLLAELGYAVQFTHDADARPIQSSGRYVWQGEHGRHLATQGWWAEHLLAIASEHWSLEVRRVARDIMRIILARHLGNKPLQSRQLFQSKT